MSLPSRERGLKFKLLDDVLDMSRRSPRGSADWNNCQSHGCTDIKRRSPRGSADWNAMPWAYKPAMSVAPLAGARIEIVPDRNHSDRSTGRSPRGSADWNARTMGIICFFNMVAPLAGAWIEIEKTIVYNVLCDYIEGGHLIEQDGQAKRLGNGNAYGSPILEKRNDTGRIWDGKQIFE